MQRAALGPCRARPPARLQRGLRSATGAGPLSHPRCAVLSPPAACAKPVVAYVEPTSWSSRKVFASVEIQAPLELVWGCLTDYARLHTFIPSLVENRCLERRATGCRLYQVGAQDVALGIKFSARVTVDVEEHPQGIAPVQVFRSGQPAARLFPYPQTCLQNCAHTRDISFMMVDGDFQDFRGIWRLQPIPGHQNGASSAAGTYLSYAVYVQPQQWLPVGLIQGRIQNEVCGNLQAVRAFAEALCRHGAPSRA